MGVLVERSTPLAAAAGGQVQLLFAGHSVSAHEHKGRFSTPWLELVDSTRQEGRHRVAAGLAGVTRGGCAAGGQVQLLFAGHLVSAHEHEGSFSTPWLQLVDATHGRRDLFEDLLLV